MGGFCVGEKWDSINFGSILLVLNLKWEEVAYEVWVLITPMEKFEIRTRLDSAIHLVLAIANLNIIFFFLAV